MTKIIAVANQKGGVGKTTTTVNLSACLAEQGQRVLLIDTDPQGNATSGFSINKVEQEKTIYELLLGECSINECIIKDVLPGISVVPANVNLAAAEIELIGIEDKEFILKKEIEWVKDMYDYILIDCPPALNTLTLNAMTTANSIIVPIQCEYLALEGLSDLITTINLVKERLNPELDLEGIVFTMYDGRTVLSQQVVENVGQHFRIKYTIQRYREMCDYQRPPVLDSRLSYMIRNLQEQKVIGNLQRKLLAERMYKIWRG